MSNTECGIVRPTNAIYMGSHSLLGGKAISKFRMPQINSFPSLSGIKAISKC